MTHAMPRVLILGDLSRSHEKQNSKGHSFPFAFPQSSLNFTFLATQCYHLECSHAVVILCPLLIFVFYAISISN